MRYLLTLFAFTLLATTAHAQMTVTEGYSFHPKENQPEVWEKSYCGPVYRFTVIEPSTDDTRCFSFLATWDRYDSTFQERIHLEYLYKKEWKNRNWNGLCTTPPQGQHLRAHFKYNDCIDGVITWRLNMIDTLGNVYASLWRECSGKIRATCNGVAVNLEGIEQMEESQDTANDTVDEKPVEKVQEEPQEKLPMEPDQILQQKYFAGKIE